MISRTHQEKELLLGVGRGTLSDGGAGVGSVTHSQTVWPGVG